MDTARRWPEFAPHALDAGFEAVAGVPMRLRRDRIGALNLFSRCSGELSQEDEQIAQAMADIATIGVLHARAIHDGQAVGAQLHTALESRVAIEQAKGIIAEHLGVSVDAAFELLRSHSRSEKAKLAESAQRVISGALRVDALGARSRRRRVDTRDEPHRAMCAPVPMSTACRSRGESRVVKMIPAT